MMPAGMSHQSDNIFAGTQVVSLVEVRGTNNSLGHPRGAVGIVTRTPTSEHALTETKLPERPDYEAANRFLIKARREMANHN
jgi:hypothetical protein